MVNKKYNFLCNIHVIPTPNMQHIAFIERMIMCKMIKVFYVQLFPWIEKAWQELF